jgi:hypothetical protein
LVCYKYSDKEYVYNKALAAAHRRRVSSSAGSLKTPALMMQRSTDGNRMCLPIIWQIVSFRLLLYSYCISLSPRFYPIIIIIIIIIIHEAPPPLDHCGDSCRHLWNGSAELPEPENNHIPRSYYCLQRSSLDRGRSGQGRQLAAAQILPSKRQ